MPADPKKPLIDLTDPLIRTLQRTPGTPEIRDRLTRGLIVRRLPSGRVQFCVRYRVLDKTKNRIVQRRSVLGFYPAVSLAKARRAATRQLVQTQEGADPVGAKRAARVALTDTVDALATEYLAKHVERKTRSMTEIKRILDRNILPSWGARSVRDLSRRDIRNLLEAVVQRGAPVMANKILEVIRAMFNYGVRNDWLDANPAARLDRPGASPSRDRVLTDDEIRALWALLSRFPATDEKQAPGRKRAAVNAKRQPFCPLSPALASVQKLRLLTAQRGGEVVRMQWNDLEIEPAKTGQPARGWWTIPAEHAKNEQTHRVPLTADAIALIEAQQPDVKKRSGHVFVGREGANSVHRIRKAGAACASLLGFDMRSHDLRRTAATRMAAAGVPRESISAVLNHIQAGPTATRVYDRYSRDREKQAALETWQRELRRILSNKAGVVVHFAR